MKLLIIPPLMILGACCLRATPSPIDVAPPPMPCMPIYGRAADWDVISDDLARNIYRHNLLCAGVNDG